MELTRKIGEFIRRTTLAEIPGEVLSRAKKNVLDSIGVGLIGSREPAGQIGLRLARWIGGSPGSGIFGSPFKTSPGLAAWVNGTMIHALDYDDRNWSMTGHPSASILPVALALGEKERLRGSDVLLSYIIGLEVACKLGRGVLPEHSEKGWHQTATLGGFGATACAGKLFSLGEGELEAAFGLALSQISGTKQNFGTMTKPLHTGQAAANGIQAASLAKRGFTSSGKAFEGPGGFFDVFCSAAQVDPGQILIHLGDPYEFIHPGVHIKAYPSCGGTHSTIEAILGLTKEFDLLPEQVEKIRCGVHYRRPMTLIRDDPQTPLEGKFSLPYCAAVSLIDRRVGLAQFTEERMKDPRVRELMGRVEMYVHPEMTEKHSPFQYASEVTIHARDGRILRERVNLARGNPGQEISESERIDKFMECASSILTRDEASRVMEWVDQLEKLPHIEDLSATICREKSISRE